MSVGMQKPDRRGAAAKKSRIFEVSSACPGAVFGVLITPNGLKDRARKEHVRWSADGLKAAAAWDAAAILTPAHSESSAEFGNEIRARFMEWLPLTADESGIPGASADATWFEHSSRIRNLVATGNRVLVHDQGVGRSAGAIVARLLVEMGFEPDEAISAVRRALGSQAVRTSAQEAWVRAGRHQADRSKLDEASTRDRAVGSLLGLAVGDAVGTTLEFSPKPRRAVIADMVGGGPFALQPGQWTDDTAMALTLGESLLANPGLDPLDLMQRFVSWFRKGTYSCTGTCFDIGVTTAVALRHFERTGQPFAGSTEPQSAGNGSIMRLAPVAIRHWRDRDTMLRVASDQSRTTHGAAEAVECCKVLAELVAKAIAGATLRELVQSDAAGRIHRFRTRQPRAEVHGTGYVVASLHAALWAVSRTSTFRDAVLLAANLGEDADTTAAVAGQIAGALYGAQAIPPEWLGRLAWSKRIERLGGALFDEEDGGGGSASKD